MGFRVKFWGVRGSIACSSPDHVVYGGNTSCVAMTAGDHLLIFDAGTGIRALGREVLRLGLGQAHMFFTHTHWDHINGFPFFAPAFSPAFKLHIHGPRLVGSPNGIHYVLSNQMENPNFPVPLSVMQGIASWEDFDVGQNFHPYEGVTLRTAPLNHPNGACGYRVEAGGVAVCHITDTEHRPGEMDENVLALMQGADLAIYDSTYADAEYPGRVGWGHSTWQEGVRLARFAGAKRLAIFHHDPDHTDDIMAAIETEAAQSWDGTLVARDGMELTLA